MRILLAASALSLAGSALAVPVTVHAQSAVAPPPMLFGISYDGDWRSELDDFAAQQGKYPALYQLYFTPELFDTPQPWVSPMLEDLAARGMTGWVEWTTQDVSLLEPAEHEQRVDNLMSSMADYLRAAPNDDTRGVIIAPLPEANLTEHPWAGDPALFKTITHQMRRRAATAGLDAHIRWAFSMNGFSSPGQSYADYWPGEYAFDIVAFSRLNRGDDQDGWRDYGATFGDYIPALREQTSLAKPVIVAQTGVGTRGGDRDAWLTDMFSGLADDPSVIGALYFNKDRTADLRIHSLAGGIALNAAVRTGYDNWSDPDQATWLYGPALDAWVVSRAGTPALPVPVARALPADCANASAAFTDTAGSVHSTAIACVADREIAAGYPDGTFRPAQSVTRGQVATFLARTIRSTDATLPDDPDDAFGDDTGSAHETAINQLAELEIITDPGATFGPNAPATRQTMSQWTARTLLHLGTQLEAEPPRHFPDVSGGSMIDQLAAAGIVTGRVDQSFAPQSTLTRAQMATFLGRSIDATDD